MGKKRADQTDEINEGILKLYQLVQTAQGSLEARWEELEHKTLKKIEELQSRMTVLQEENQALKQEVRNLAGKCEDIEKQLAELVAGIRGRIAISRRDIPVEINIPKESEPINPKGMDAGNDKEWYSPPPDKEGIFYGKYLTRKSGPNTATFLLRLENDVYGKFSIVENQENIEYAMNMIDDYLSAGFEIYGKPSLENGGGFTIEEGEISKEGRNWIITKKGRITFST